MQTKRAPKKSPRALIQNRKRVQSKVPRVLPRTENRTRTKRKSPTSKTSRPKPKRTSPQVSKVTTNRKHLMERTVPAKRRFPRAQRPRLMTTKMIKATQRKSLRNRKKTTRRKSLKSQKLRNRIAVKRRMARTIKTTRRKSLKSRKLRNRMAVKRKMARTMKDLPMILQKYKQVMIPKLISKRRRRRNQRWCCK